MIRTYYYLLDSNIWMSKVIQLSMIRTLSLIKIIILEIFIQIPQFGVGLILSLIKIFMKIFILEIRFK